MNQNDERKNMAQFRQAYEQAKSNEKHFGCISLELILVAGLLGLAMRSWIVFIISFIVVGFLFFYPKTAPFVSWIFSFFWGAIGYAIGQSLLNNVLFAIILAIVFFAISLGVHLGAQQHVKDLSENNTNNAAPEVSVTVEHIMSDDSTLRALYNLEMAYKSGVITQIEYEEKKRNLLQ